MSRLRDLDLRPEYRSDQGDPLREFYIPCLERSTQYSRAVGYFTSDGLSLSARGLSRFAQGSGQMRLVASPVLTEDDQEAMLRGYRARADVVEHALLGQLNLGDLTTFQIRRLACLAWLIAEQRLEIRIAVRTEPRARGIYHEKMGIFQDATGDIVAFSGSSNETVGGLLNNFETIDVFMSWEDPQGRVNRKAHNFERLWVNETPGLEVISFPEAARRRLLEIKPERPPSDDPELEIASPARLGALVDETCRTPPEIKIRPYQLEALRAWMTNDYQGIFEMATGTGKTITALNAVSHLAERHEQLAVVVLVPYQHLVDQWAGEAHQFGLKPVRGYGSSATWQPRLRERLDLYNAGARSVVSLIATHAASATPEFAHLFQDIRPPLVLVADEVHHLGAQSGRASLLDIATARLGLSATPQRWMDPEGTGFLLSYFDGVVFEYSLGEAIDHGHLTPYEYTPELVQLTPEEIAEYARLTRLIASAFQDARGDQRLGHLLRQRSDLLNRAEGKLDLLPDLIEAPRQTQHTLFYCAPGQIDEVIELLGHQLAMQVHRFTARENPKDRQNLLSRFSDGRLQALVAMRCLDEGVDVPSTRSAFLLASSGNPREFIQRRGRILRRAPGKTRARITDLVAVPALESLTADAVDTERRIMERELRRFVEFADHALNTHTAKERLWPIAEALGLLHLM